MPVVQRSQVVLGHDNLNLLLVGTAVEQHVVEAVLHVAIDRTEQIGSVEASIIIVVARRNATEVR